MHESEPTNLGACNFWKCTHEAAMAQKQFAMANTNHSAIDS